MKDPGLFTLPCRLGDLKPFDTLADLGSCVNIIPLYLFKKLNIRLLEETEHIFGLANETKSYPVRIVKDVEVHIGKLKLLNDFYVIDTKKDPETPLIIGRGFLATANTVIDCKMAKIVVGEGITRKFLFKNKEEIFTDTGHGVRIIPDGIVSLTSFETIGIHGSIHLMKNWGRSFSTWMEFGGNTRDLGSFGEETDKIMEIYQIREEVLLTKYADSVAGIKQRHRDPSSDDVWNLETTSGRRRLKEDLESSTLRTKD
nr:hypothetical protein [Tanacetum cinerariifolium]